MEGGAQRGGAERAEAGRTTNFQEEIFLWTRKNEHFLACYLSPTSLSLYCQNKIRMKGLFLCFKEAGAQPVLTNLPHPALSVCLYLCLAYHLKSPAIASCWPTLSFSLKYPFCETFPPICGIFKDSIASGLFIAEEFISL